MKTIEQNYIETLKLAIFNKISSEINEKSIDQILKIDLYKSHISNKNLGAFLLYYFKTLQNEELFLKTAFFQHFRNKYKLRADNEYLDRLESHKIDILKMLQNDNITELYFKEFDKTKSKFRDKFIEKDQGSFFAKLVHTFRPDEYCALDNPIKNYFGLKNESFFIAFSIISYEYKHWAKDNKELVKTIRDKFKLIDKDQIVNHKLLTDIKLLDLIFWSKAKKVKREKKEDRILT